MYIPDRVIEIAPVPVEAPTFRTRDVCRVGLEESDTVEVAVGEIPMAKKPAG